MPSSIGILSKLPAELAYLAEPAMKFGVHHSDDAVTRFLQNTTDQQMEELAGVAERVRRNGHHDAVEDFVDRFEMTDYAESANLYFLFGVMDAAGLDFVPDDWNTVAKHMEALSRFGSFRLASMRMHAAKFLAGFGAQAKPALPLLWRALQDEDERVRVWAHYALAVVEGNRAVHEKALRDILAKHDEQDEVGLRDEIGAEAEAALEKLLELEMKGGSSPAL